MMTDRDGNLMTEEEREDYEARLRDFHETAAKFPLGMFLFVPRGMSSAEARLQNRIRTGYRGGVCAFVEGV
jgi:hypothetical protein